MAEPFEALAARGGTLIPSPEFTEALRRSSSSNRSRATSPGLSEPNRRAARITTNSPEKLASTLRPGDMLLVEGNSRFSTAINYLTLHLDLRRALYRRDAGRIAVRTGAEGARRGRHSRRARAVPLSEYSGLHTRICRPIGSPRMIQGGVDYAVSRIGHQCDLKNVTDLPRYLVPTSPVCACPSRRTGPGVSRLSIPLDRAHANSY